MAVQFARRPRAVVGPVRLGLGTTVGVAVRLLDRMRILSRNVTVGRERMIGLQHHFVMVARRGWLRKPGAPTPIRCGKLDTLKA